MKKKYRESHYHLFICCVLIVLGGMAYRFDPTTFAYRPWSLDVLHAFGHRNSDFPRVHFDLHRAVPVGGQAPADFAGAGASSGTTWKSITSEFIPTYK